MSHMYEYSPSASPAACAPKFHVLVVCTGNIYRSPLAACLLRQRLFGAGQAVRLSSAGTRAVPGKPLAAAAASFLAGRGADASATVSRRLTVGMVDSADLVLGAATEHREAAVRLSPVRAMSRAFTLREFARLVQAGDAAGLVDPAARFEALVRAAAARRGTAVARRGEDDVDDPIG